MLRSPRAHDPRRSLRAARPRVDSRRSPGARLGPPCVIPRDATRLRPLAREPVAGRTRPPRASVRGHAALASANGSSTTSAVASPTATRVAGRGLAAHDRQADRPERGETTRCRCGRPRARRAAAACRRDRRREPQPAQVAVGLALVVQAGDGLLADVAALGEADGPVVEAGFLGDDGLVELDAVAGAAALDAHDLGVRLGGRVGAGGEQCAAHASVSAPSQRTSMPASVTTSRTGRRRARRRRWRARLRQRGGAGDLARPRPDQREQPRARTVRLCSSTS